MKNSDDIVRKKPTKATAKELQEYWTPERRASAKPLPLPTIKRKEFPKEELKTARPVIRSGKKRTKNRDANIESGLGTLRGGMSVGNPLDYPYCCVGKLFMTRNGKTWQASASAIDPHIILTAGHCLYDYQGGGFGTWFDNIAFYPDYNYLNPPVSFVSSGDWAIFREWMNDGDHAYDLGMIHIAEDMYSTMCGYLGWIYNYIAPWMEFIGYPCQPNPPYNCFDMYFMEGYTYLAPLVENYVCMENNDMHGGSSGSPWIATVDGGLYVNGITCGGYDNDPNTACSPRFDGKFQRLWDSAQT